MPLHLQCPICGRAIEWSEAFPLRPFCSERCRLLDLGGWLSEERRIPAQSGEGVGSAAESAKADSAADERNGGADADGETARRLRVPRRLS